jgi:hypothetical protein
LFSVADVKIPELLFLSPGIARKKVKFDFAHLSIIKQMLNFRNVIYLIHKGITFVS